MNLYGRQPHPKMATAFGRETLDRFLFQPLAYRRVHDFREYALLSMWVPGLRAGLFNVKANWAALFAAPFSAPCYGAFYLRRTT